MSFWKFLDILGGIVTYVRNFVINFIFLIIAFFVFIAILASIATEPEETVWEANQIVYINPQFTIYDSPRMESRIEVLLNAINGTRYEHLYTEQLRKIFDAAAGDTNVKAVVLDLSSTEAVRLDVIHSLTPAIEKFKKAGKKIFAYADSYSQSTYALATFADKIYLSKFGDVSVTGVNARNLYFKDLLDNVEITVYTPKAGTHKSAVEPFNRNDMSPQVKDEMNLITSELWNQYTDIIKKNRPDLDVNSLLFASDELIALEESTPDDKNIYQEAGAVDGIMNRNAFFKNIAKAYNIDYRYNHLKNNYEFDTTDAEQYFDGISSADTLDPDKEKTIGVIYGLGEISYQDPNDSDLTKFTPEHIVPLIQRAIKNNYAGLVLYLNTPGGSVTASEEIRAALQEYKEKTNGKIVVYMSGMTASGGYWISTVADEIVAQPSTITGSIGVFGMLFNGSKLTDNLGIHEDGVGTNPNANISFTSPLTDNQKKVIQLEINKTYHSFLKLVSDSRKIDIDKVDELAQGKIYTGYQALNLKLVDRIGSFDTALNTLIDITKTSNPQVTVLMPKDDNSVSSVSNLLVKAVARYDRPMALRLLDRMIDDNPAVKAAVKHGYGINGESQIMIQPYSISY